MAKRCMGCMKTYSEEFDICPHCGYVEGTPPKEAYHLRPETLLKDRYIIGKVVGYGGFGVTYAAWDKLLEQKVAIKEYLPGEFATRVPGEEPVTIYSGENANQFEIGKKKFSEEAKHLAQFNSVDGVVEIKDTFQTNRTAYIVMEFLEGETLKERLSREGRIAPDEALEITKGILETLSKVHKGDIIHRDIAPDNVFLCSDGRIKLLDFGAARYATVQHSKSLSVILKEGYAPEEQYRSKGEQGSWSDVYAVGATLYKMLTGVTPEDAMERAEKDRLKPVSKYGVKLSKEVDTALMNALNVFTEDRTKTAEEFMTELEADSVARKARTRKKIDIGKWPMWSKIAICCAVAVLAFSGYMISRKSVYALEEGQTYVPEVINLTDEKAQKAVEKRDLTLKVIGQEKSEKVEMAKVMSQYPDAGRVVNIGEMVEVKISAGSTVEMVDLSGKTQEEAEQILKDMGFTDVEFVEEESAAKEGTMIAQSAEAGEDVKTGGKITVVVSGGMKDVDKTQSTKVPDMEGMTYQSAAEKAADKKIYIQQTESRPSSKPAGTVIEQSVSAGTSVKEGMVVNVVVSAGEQKVKVPYVEYMSESEAKRVLGAYNLKSSVSYVSSDTVESGLVITQSKSAGSKVKPGTTVKLTVSKGREKVSVPSVSGMNYKDAEQKLMDKGFRYSVNYVHSESISYGKVISYSPSGKQEKGTKVALTVSKGTAGKLVSASEYNDRYSDSGKYSASPRYRYATRQMEYKKSGAESLSGWTRGKKVVTKSKIAMDWSSDDGDGTIGIGKSKLSDGSGYYAENKLETRSTYRAYAYFCNCGKCTMSKEMNTKGMQVSHLKGCDKITKNLLEVYTMEPLSNSGYVRHSDGAYKAPQYLKEHSTYNGIGEVIDLTYYRKNGSNLYGGFYSQHPSNCTWLYYDSKKTGKAYRITHEEYYYEYSRLGEWSSYGEWTTKRETSNTVKEDETVKYYIVGKEPS